MFRYWRHLFLLSAESHCVMMLRTVKLARGGASALDEAWRILTEKTSATAEIPRRVLGAKSPLRLAVDYRKMVRSNLRRLSGQSDQCPDSEVAVYEPRPEQVRLEVEMTANRLDRVD